MSTSEHDPRGEALHEALRLQSQLGKLEDEYATSLRKLEDEYATLLSNSQARIDELEAALRPFAEIGGGMYSKWTDDTAVKIPCSEGRFAWHTRVGEWRAAAKALENKE